MKHSVRLICLVLSLLLLAGCQSEAVDPAPTPTAVFVPPTLAADAERVRFVLDGRQSTAVYRVEERFLTGGIDYGDARTEGETGDINGRFELAFGDTVQLAGGEIEVDLRTLISGNEIRDRAIRSQWLESDRFPFAHFELQEIVDFPASWQAGEPLSFRLAGLMTIRDVTQPLTFDVEATLLENQLSGVATSFLLMEDYGFDPPFIPGIVEVTDGVRLTIRFEAVREP